MIYAKSNPKETLREHTDELKYQLVILRNSYGCKIENILKIDSNEFWRMLDIIVEFHDLGKVFTPFQNVIRERIGEEFLSTTFENDIYHNYISPAFLNYKELEIEKTIKPIVVQAIGYHHERDVIIDNLFKEKIQEILEVDIQHSVEKINLEFKPKYPIKSKKLKNTYLEYMHKRIQPSDENFNLYILLKGLTHRLDHSASAHEAIELNKEHNVGEYTEKFIIKNHNKLRPVQEFASENKDKNIILIASTGMGKTETALIWIDNDKAFFTLPLRVSINALFDRVSKEDIKYEYAGLLHSSSLDYMQENKYRDYEERVNQSKLMSTKLTFSTIDQIFKFPFMYRGYEKEYATLSYSKVVIDEIQAYSPEISAVLIKGIEMIHKIGGKFMIMTATMPTIYMDELKSRGVFDENIEIRTFNTLAIRHNVKIEYSSLKDNLGGIVESAQNNKILIIVNTVRSAIETYEFIKNMDEKINLNLLHSMYIQEHRSKLETDIKKFVKGAENGIWVTTQLVEASLDVDFDVLHTEISVLDSLFQRFGRCNRKGTKSIDYANIFIYTKEATGIGTIYDEDVVNKGILLLEECLIEESGTINSSLKISEDDKVKMVQTLYSKDSLKGTKFYSKFKKALEVLDAITPYELSKSEAQGVLRDIESDTVIPRDIYESIRDTYIEMYVYLGTMLNEAYKNKYINKAFLQYLKEQRRVIRREILKKTVNVPTYKTKKGGVSPINIKGLEDLKILEFKYDICEIDGRLTGKGVLIGEELSNIIW